MRGVGKTTLGLIIATFLNRGFIDTDRLFERLFSITVRDFVHERGLDAFRERESAVLEQLLRVHSKGKVIALGGGVVEIPGNRALLAEWARTQGPVIHVCRQMESVFQYLLGRRTKSTWAVLEEEYRTIWERRLGWYEACSNFTLFTVTCKNPAHPSLALKPVERSIHRLISTITSSPSAPPHLDVSWTAPRTSALVVLGAFLAIHDSDWLKIVSQGVDAYDLQVDTIVSTATSSHTTPRPISPLGTPPLLDPISFHQQHYGPGNPDPFLVAHAIALLRLHSFLPIIYTVRTLSQGGTFAGNREQYLRLVQHGFRTLCEFVDIELTLPDEEILQLLSHRRTGIRIILSWTWTSPEAARWSWLSAEVRRVYDRAVVLGADVVRLSKPALVPADNFHLAELLANLAAERNVPLIATNLGRAGQMSRLFNTVLTPVTHLQIHPSPEHGELSLRELQQGLVSVGLVPRRKVYDLVGQRAPFDVRTVFQTAFDAYGLGFDLAAAALDSPPLSSLVTEAHFAGAIVTQPIGPSPGLSASAKGTGFIDVVYTSPPPSLPLFHPPSPLVSHPQVTFDNLRTRAIQYCITHHLSPVNYLGSWTSVALDLAGSGTTRLAKEVLWALADLGVRHLFAVNCDDEAAHFFENAASPVLAEVVRLATLNEVNSLVGSRLPTIVVSFASRPALPTALAESNKGGVILEMMSRGAGEKATNGESGEEDGWIRLGRRAVEAKLLRLQFAAIAGTDMPEELLPTD